MVYYVWARVWPGAKGRTSREVVRWPGKWSGLLGHGRDCLRVYSEHPVSGVGVEMAMERKGSNRTASGAVCTPYNSVLRKVKVTVKVCVQ